MDGSFPHSKYDIRGSNRTNRVSTHSGIMGVLSERQMIWGLDWKKSGRSASF